MRAKPDSVQWHVLLDDAKWNTDQPTAELLRRRGVEPLEPEANARRRVSTRALLAILLATGLLLAAAGGWLWWRAQEGLQLLKQDLEETVALDVQLAQPAVTFLLQDPRDASTETPAAPHRSTLAFIDLSQPGEVETKVLAMDMVDDRALVEVEVHDPRLPLPYRETRFYRLVEGSWMQTGPAMALLGEPERHESAHFIFHFYSRDQEAVQEAAPLLDARYEQLYSQVGMPWPARPMTVWLRPEPVTQRFMFATSSSLQEEIQLTSPLLLRRPVDLSDGQVLAEAVAVRLAFRVSAEFSLNAPRSWRAIQPGLRLWLIWNSAGRLALGKEEVIRWMHPQGANQEPWRLVKGAPERYPELCQNYWFWNLRPYVLGIPINCDNQLQDLLRPNAISTKLYHLPVPSQYWELSGINTRFSPGRTVATATLFDYVAAAYGPEAVTEMLESFRRYRRMESLIQEVFGVSPETFEAGWAAHVTAF